MNKHYNKYDGHNRILKIFKACEYHFIIAWSVPGNMKWIFQA